MKRDTRRAGDLPGVEATLATADVMLAPDDPLPRPDDLTALTQQLRGHLCVFISMVESHAEGLPAGHKMRVVAERAVENARVRADASPGPGLVSANNHALSLARELRALLDCHRTLTGGRVRQPRWTSNFSGPKRILSAERSEQGPRVDE